MRILRKGDTIEAKDLTFESRVTYDLDHLPDEATRTRDLNRAGPAWHPVPPQWVGATLPLQGIIDPEIRRP